MNVRAEPLWFGPAERPRFGWVHRPAPATAMRDTGVVICNPFGYEALCAHRSLRHFAESAAALGYPAMRFDYDGTGDSAGEDLDADRLSAWRASVLDAVRELRKRTGVTRVCLLGVRLGGLIAALAAADSAAVADAVAGLALVAPVTNGKLWLRETRALQAAMGRAPAPARFALPDSVQESVGLLLGEATREEIGASEIAALASRLPREILILDRSDRPPLAAFAAELQSGGSTVRHAVLPGFVEMMLDPHAAMLPEAKIAEFSRWLTDQFPAAATAGAGPRATGARDVGARRSASAAPVTVAAGVEEQLCFIDPAERLFGIVSTPTGVRPTRALLLLNSGANHHIGNGRMYVKFARRLAARGWVVLRYDVSGIGDSEPHEGAPENEVYTSHAVADLGAALAFVRAQFAVTHVESVGLCSGAYHSFKGAVAALPLHGLLVANPLVFFWKPGMSLAYPPFRMVQAAEQYQRSMLRADKWLKLLRGQVDLREVLRVVAHRAEDRARSLGREVARVVRLPVEDDLAAEVATIVQRGIALRFLFSDADPGESLLRVGAGTALGRLERRGALRVDHLADCDHSLSSVWMHEALWAWLIRSLDRDPQRR